MKIRIIKNKKVKIKKTKQTKKINKWDIIKT